MIWRHHRQSGKGLGGLSFTALAAFERPGTYMIASPTGELGRENYWDAINPDTGTHYLDVIPPPLVVDKNENERALTMRTAVEGQTSRLIFRSADDPDRLRGPAYAGVVLDEFATMPGREPLDIVRIPVERSGGWLLITSTPKGMNHFYDVWKNAEAAGGWYLSTKTIEDTRRHDGAPIIPLSVVEQERREGQAEPWILQEYFVAFTAALVSSYYGDVLTTAEADGRILDLPHRTDLRTLTGWDLGWSDDTVIVYVQERGEWLDVVDCEGFTGVDTTGAVARLQAHGYVFREHLAPHDADQHNVASGQSPKEVAARLGVRFRVVPKTDVQWGIDAVRRLFPRLRFDRRRCAKLLEALAGYEKQWDPRGKVFRDRPLHSWHSHYADALRTFAVGYREPIAHDPNAKQRYAASNITHRSDTGSRRALGSIGPE
jgi:phage terminase large subunit